MVTIFKDINYMNTGLPTGITVGLYGNATSPSSQLLSLIYLMWSALVVIHLHHGHFTTNDQRKVITLSSAYTSPQPGNMAYRVCTRL